MNIFTKLIAYVKGEVAELKAEATELEHKLLPGIEAIMKKTVAVFGEKALAVIEQLGSALVAGLASGGSVGVLIPQLVNDAIKDLTPELISDGKNALYTIANLAIADIKVIGITPVQPLAPITTGAQAEPAEGVAVS